MGPSRYGLKREQIFDELMTAMNSSDPLEQPSDEADRWRRSVVNDLGRS